MIKSIRIGFLMFFACLLLPSGVNAADDDITRVFIFAGQSNMVGSDSRVDDIKHFPPFRGLEKHQPSVLFSFCLGRNEKSRSDGWVALQPVDNVVGPELSFARKVTQHIDAPIAVIKCAAGGTHLGGDWNPDSPAGFKMYPLALELIKSSLADLDKRKIRYRLEAVMWHQGENDMFEKEYMANYGKNLANFLSRWRQDLNSPNLRFYIGELCTKTIWGMDLRPRMYAISQGQRAVTESDPFADYVPTSHIAVEIGQPVGLHYHYGTLGQLELGENYADAYLTAIGKPPEGSGTLKRWPYRKGQKVKLFVLAGHRNMEGERAFVQELESQRSELLQANQQIAFKYNLGGGIKASNDWEPLGAAGYYQTFGPELSFGHRLQKEDRHNIAIAKFTHSGSQINDWTPEGTEAKSRHIYPQFIGFVKASIEEIKSRGNEVEFAGIFYHVGENEMSMPSYRKRVAKWLRQLVERSRFDLAIPDLKWYVSQQPPTNHKNVNSIDVISDIETVAALDSHLVHIKVFDLPKQKKEVVLDTMGVVRLGEIIADGYLNSMNNP